MKKNLSLVFFLFVIVAFAQNFQKSDVVINGSIGLAGASYNPVGKSTIPPIQASGEYFVDDKISVGGFLGYAAYKDTHDSVIFGFDTGYKLKTSYILLGALANYHFYDQEKLNFYGGLSLGYAIANASLTYNDPSMAAFAGTTKTAASAVAWGLQLGGRYFFTDNLAANLELGYGLALLKLGISYKL